MCGAASDVAVIVRSDLVLRWPDVLRGATAPKQVVFLVSLILAVIAWISVFAGIPYIGEHPSFLLTLAYVVLALGCYS
jgi:hypothetical protein